MQFKLLSLQFLRWLSILHVLTGHINFLVAKHECTLDNLQVNPDKMWGACFLHHLNGHRLKS